MKNNYIQIEEVRLYRLRMNLKHPFSTSFGTLTEKEFFIIEIIDDQKTIGYGESVAFISPWYTDETVTTVEHMMEVFLIPLLFQHPFQHPREVAKRFQVVKGNPMAKSALEGAYWDLYAKRFNQPLWELIGGVRTEVEVGVSIGIQPSITTLLKKIEHYLQEGYKRIKLKIKPGYDIDVLKEVRKVFPQIPIMVDANSAYSLKDIETLKKLDTFHLLMIEQPFGEREFLEHAELQKQLHTPICLDESIRTIDDLKLATKLGSGKIFNIKIGRIGGLSEAIEMHQFSKENRIPLWCGGMLESGVGRAMNIALASLEQFRYPGDISASNRYWDTDIIEPEINHHEGKIAVNKNPGIGYTISFRDMEKHIVEKKRFKNPNL
ncbi:o-succinylbenzoate synthase [Fervidibacillus halotolerans]|uniref:o-succinylbenzoate synthase n=1 Tax=Fervidibacillus halotolerans TaxID=2980027 RepID=A0A9E8S1F5_9BACI|nr:o-succinylbenzoate synthase [Fervidibacillus halotolerans]WAA13472.1 o-succinylbenzoate synthase [Fervidibacillus halotolerans]